MEGTMKRFSALFLILFVGCASIGEVRLVKNSSAMPDFVTSVPEGCIVGFSSQAKSVEEGKNLAIIDAMKQIAGAIGSQIWVDYKSSTKARNNNVERFVSDDSRLISSALLKEVEPNIRQIYFEKYWKKAKRGTEYYYDTYVLVHFPQSKINALRQQLIKENERRLEEFERVMEKGQKDDFSGAVNAYASAIKLSGSLLKDRLFYEQQATQSLESLVSSFRMTKAKAEKDNVTVQATFRNGVPVRNLPLEIRLEKGGGSIPNLVFTDDRGQAVVDTKGVTSEIADNRISVKPRINVDRKLMEDSVANIEFNTLRRNAKVEAGNIKVEVLKLSGFLIKKVEKAVLSLKLKEVNGVDIVLDRYNIKAVGFYPVFMKNTYDTVVREADFFLESPICLKGNSRVVKIELDSWACRILSDLMKDRKPSKVRIDIGFGNDENKCCILAASEFSL
jgi:hypothetical protein